MKLYENKWDLTHTPNKNSPIKQQELNIWIKNNPNVVLVFSGCLDRVIDYENTKNILTLVNSGQLLRKYKYMGSDADDNHYRVKDIINLEIMTQFKFESYYFSLESIEDTKRTEQFKAESIIKALQRVEKEPRFKINKEFIQWFLMVIALFGIMYFSMVTITN